MFRFSIPSIFDRNTENIFFSSKAIIKAHLSIRDWWKDRLATTKKSRRLPQQADRRPQAQLDGDGHARLVDAIQIRKVIEVVLSVARVKITVRSFVRSFLCVCVCVCVWR